MIRFVPFNEADYRAWLLQSVPEYALTNVQEGRWTLAESLEKSTETHASLLSQGLQTPGHFFVRLQDADSGADVGTLWWEEADRPTGREAYVYDLLIDETARRRGYARAALNELERVARERGLQQLGLHVFGRNHGARRLYEDLGFQPVSITMRKKL